MSLGNLLEEVKAQRKMDYELRFDGALLKHGRVCVPDDPSIKQTILVEAYSSAYAMHSGSTKMYQTLREHCWWQCMKREITEYVARCLICQ